MQTTINLSTVDNKISIQKQYMNSKDALREKIRADLLRLKVKAATQSSEGVIGDNAPLSALITKQPQPKHLNHLPSTTKILHEAYKAGDKLKKHILAGLRKHFGEKKIRFKDPEPRHWFLKKIFKSVFRKQSSVNKAIIRGLHEQTTVNDRLLRALQAQTKTLQSLAVEAGSLGTQVGSLGTQVNCSTEGLRTLRSELQQQCDELSNVTRLLERDASTMKGVTWALGSRLDALKAKIEKVEKDIETVQSSSSRFSQNRAASYASSAMLEAIKCLTSKSIAVPACPIPGPPDENAWRASNRKSGEIHFPLTVVIPTQGKRSSLVETIRSIFDQTIGGLDILLLDGSGNDSVESLIREFGEKPIRRLKVDPASSMSDKLKKGFEQPLNSWVTVLGDDDLLKSSFAQIALNLCTEQPGASLYQTGFEIIDEVGASLDVIQSIPKIQSGVEFLNARKHWKQPSYLAGYFFKPEDFRKVGGYRNFDHGFYSDDCLYFELALLSYKAFTPEVGASHRAIVSGGSASGRENPRVAENTSALIKYWCVLKAYAQNAPSLNEAIEDYIREHFDVAQMHYEQTLDRVLHYGDQPERAVFLRTMALSLLSKQDLAQSVRLSVKGQTEIKEMEERLERQFGV